VTKQTAQELIDWADQEGGVEYLFMGHGVDLTDFDLADSQLCDLDEMVYHYQNAQYFWQLFEDSVVGG